MESQQAEQDWNTTEHANGPQPVPSPAAKVAVGKFTNVTEDAEQRRRRQALEMQRERILSERTSSPHRRSALESALIDIEEKLTELGWTIHL